MKHPEQLKAWPSSTSFILVAIAFGAGIGNIWRYPAIAYENSGGEFFVAYIISLFFVGLPLLLIEMALGRKTELHAPGALASISPSGTFRFVGYWSILILLVIISYSSIVMSWAGSFLATASDMSWNGDAKTFFYDMVLRYQTDEKIILHLFIGSLAIWASIWFLLRKGTRTLARVITYFTPLPFICLFSIAIYGLFFQNSGEGLKEFFMIDWLKLANPSIWSSAISHSLFSLMIGFGIMFPYASILQKKVSLMRVGKAIIIGNALTALIVGIVMYSTIGLMAQKYNLPVEEVFVSNPGISFVIFSEALEQIPTPYNALAIMFFASLLILSVLTIALWIKTIIATITRYIPKLSYGVLALVACSVCFALSIPYTGSKGIFFLDIMDHFTVEYGIVLIAFIEVLISVWIFGSKNLYNFINEHNNRKTGKWIFPYGKIVLPIVLGSILAWNLMQDFSHPYRGYSSDAIITYGVFPATFILLAAVIMGIIGRHWKSKI